MVYDVSIIGSGPAGLSAAIYAKRANLSAIVIEKEYEGTGQIAESGRVDNYLGMPGISGYDLGETFREHAVKLEVEFLEQEVTRIQKEESGQFQMTFSDSSVIESKTVIYAAGASPRRVDIPGEKEYVGKGVSYCATCDGAFFRKKTTAVIGGGDVALEDAIFLARLCEKVYVIHRRDEFRGAKSLQKRLMELPNVEILWDTVPEEICGAEKVETLKLFNKKTGEKSDLAVDGVFVAVGITPNSEEFKGSVDMDPAGYIAAGEDGKTNVPGIFAAGDVRTKALRQVVTAVADGANCVASVEQYLYGIE